MSWVDCYHSPRQISSILGLLTKIKQLEKILGRKIVETEILKDVLGIAQVKSTYHTCHGLKMKSPREFRMLKLAS